MVADHAPALGSCARARARARAPPRRGPAIGASTSLSGRCAKTASISSSSVAASERERLRAGLLGGEAGSLESDASSDVHRADDLAEPLERVQEARRIAGERGERERPAVALGRHEAREDAERRVDQAAGVLVGAEQVGRVREAVRGQEAQQLDLRVVARPRAGGRPSARAPRRTRPSCSSAPRRSPAASAVAGTGTESGPPVGTNSIAASSRRDAAALRIEVDQLGGRARDRRARRRPSSRRRVAIGAALPARPRAAGRAAAGRSR